jgi:hypothetical protein
MASGGPESTDAPTATGGTDAVGSGGVGGMVATGGVEALGGTGGTPSDGASGGSTAMADGGAGGSAGSAGQTETGGSGGDGGDDAGASGGQIGTGGAGGSGTDGAANGGDGGTTDVRASDGGICIIGQCPPTATIGITGPWNATYSNGTSGTVVTSGDDSFMTWLTSRGINCAVQNLDISGNNYLTAARLAPYQVIVVLDIYHSQADKNAFFKAKLTNAGFPAYPGTQRAILTSEANAVRDWVNGGGGLMTIIGTASIAAEMTNANLLLNPFGIAYSVTDVNILPGNSTVTAFSTVAPIASRIAAGVSTLRVGGAVDIEGLAGGALPNNSSTFSLYASSPYTSRAGPGIYALGVAKIVGGLGRVNVWGDEAITYDITWNNSAYQTRTYWNNALNWLGQCP